MDVNKGLLEYLQARCNDPHVAYELHRHLLREFPQINHSTTLQHTNNREIKLASIEAVPNEMPTRYKSGGLRGLFWRGIGRVASKDKWINRGYSWWPKAEPMHGRVRTLRLERYSLHLPNGERWSIPAAYDPMGDVLYIYGDTP